MKVFFLSLNLCVFSVISSCSAQNFDKFSADFVAGYKSLHIPALELSYVSGLKNIGSPAHVKEQLNLFNSIKAQLAAYKRESLSAAQLVDYDVIKYETSLNLERLALEQQ